MKASALPGLPDLILAARLPYWQSAALAALFAGLAASSSAGC